MMLSIPRFTLILGVCAVYGALAASNYSEYIVTELQANLTETQLETYLIRAASLDEIVANVITNLPNLPLTQELCLIEDISNFTAAFTGNETNAEEIIGDIITTCDPDHTGLYDVLEPFTASTADAKIGAIVEKFFKKWPKDVTKIVKSIVTFVTAKKAKKLTDKEVKALEKELLAIDTTKKDYQAVEKLLPCTKYLLESGETYNAAYTTLIKSLGYIFGTETATTAEITAVNSAIAQIYEFAHIYLMDYISFGLDWLLEQSEASYIKKNETAQSEIASAASSISTTLEMVWTSLPDYLDEFFDNPFTLTSSDE